jgi:hypothetical protein
MIQSSTPSDGPKIQENLNGRIGNFTILLNGEKSENYYHLKKSRTFEMQEYKERIQFEAEYSSSKVVTYSFFLFFVSLLGIFALGFAFFRSLYGDFLPWITLPNDDLKLLAIPIVAVWFSAVLSSGYLLFNQIFRRRKF